MKRGPNLQSCFYHFDLTLRPVGTLFTKGHAIHGELGFRLTERADCHGYFNRRPGLFVLWRVLNVNTLFDLIGVNLKVIYARLWRLRRGPDRPPLPATLRRTAFRPPARPIQYSRNMKARVFVSFKPTVLDPQGQTICGALNGLGHKTIAAVRQGKFFDLEVAPGAGPGPDPAGDRPDRPRCAGQSGD